MRIEVRKSAIRDLNKMDRKKREKIHEKILELAQFPEVTGVKKLTNFEPAYRLRVGDYRVLFDVSEEVVQVGRVLHRKESYK
ncbi:MAG: type II toxin-antitoxin system RelE/ParE family toxin [Gammaproteobacteria bacterium]|nr:type II toxin-antitoxin system RelE/ParE family toxin [Gammaproteobacteria bacterium]